MQPMPKDLVKTRLKQARVARLATADAEGRPHVVPVCFVYERGTFYIALDLKPKNTAPEGLARVRNIRANPQVALVIDQYSDDWEKLWYILVRGRAEILADGREGEVCGLLKEKYPPYANGLLPEDAPLIRIKPSRIISWGRL
jgi:PPOX class probable F420-dependent enzyme